MESVAKAAFIELLRPKTVPEGLIALGTVSRVCESLLKVQITGGITCLIDQTNLSQVYCDLLEKNDQSATPNKSAQPPKLSQLFKQGQQYVCKIIERKTRKGYASAQDIHATLDPTSILEDVVPATLLSIPHVPMQCVVKSIEDHGYHMDIGLKGLTGFLKFEDAADYCDKYNDEKQFLVGQVVRCCLMDSLTLGEDTRIVHLTLDKAALKNSPFSKENCLGVRLSERVILPGSKSFLTVMKVEKNGLIVNFMNEFAGFVTLDQLKEAWHTPKDYKISDQLDCTVLYHNSTINTFALSLRPPSGREKTLKYIQDNYHIGKFIDDAKVVYLRGIRAVCFKIGNSLKALANVNDALDEDVGTLTKDEIHLALDAKYPDDSIHRCRIKSINYADLVIVVDLRKEFLERPYLSVEELKTGSFMSVVVKKYVKDGIVVSFGLNLRAIIMNEHLQDYVSSKSYKKYPIGKTIKCRVLRLDLDKQPPRAFLTNKTQYMDDKITIIDSYDRSWKGVSTHATVVKINPTGVIIEFFNGVKGFLPNRFTSSANLKEVGPFFTIGKVVPCTVYRVDPARCSIVAKENIGSKPVTKTITQKDKEAVQTTKTRAQKREEDVENIETTTQKSEEAVQTIKSRRQRSEEAMQKEAHLRETEKQLTDPNRPPQSILDFERLILKTPNSADIWIKYSRFFLDNVETEKARIVCRRALKTINFSQEKEKLKVWLHLIKIEAKYGGNDRLRDTITEAARVNDQLMLYHGAVKVLTNCGELDEAEGLFELMIKVDRTLVDIWISYIGFAMEQRKDLDRARALLDRAVKSVLKEDLINLKSRFARLEFKSGDVERGKTIFEQLLNDNPKRTDLWKFFEQMIRKYGTRQVDSMEVQEQNEQTLKRVAESIETVSKKAKKMRVK